METATVTAFTPSESLFGGALIGLSAVMVMGLFGRIAGISGITNRIASHGKNLSILNPKGAF